MAYDSGEPFAKKEYFGAALFYVMIVIAQDIGYQEG